MKSLGIDAGAFSVKFVLKNEEGEILFKEEKPHHNKVKNVCKELLGEVSKYTESSEKVKTAVTGSMSHLLNLPKDSYVDEKRALVRGLKEAAPTCKSMILIGAQKTYYVELDEGSAPFIQTNSNCSAGTGAFFEEQATRLQIPLNEISKEVAKATSIPQIAGRCSVFSKTDMIHRMQEGATTPDILKGLCYALVRNYKSSILKNKRVKTPVFFAGGVMKNTGVVTALEDLLELDGNKYLLDDKADFINAIGATEYGDLAFTVEEILKSLEAEVTVKNFSVYSPLFKYRLESDSPEFEIKEMIPGEETYLGVDIGSTSINLVLINAKKEVLYLSYVKTLGKPLDIVNAELCKLKEKLPNANISKIAVTGSGREYIGKEIGATLVINEISAQTEGALLHYGDCDTIFEIGGQDSKYMQTKNGKMADFEMNKVCAAGTGAFLEEQIKKLGISMQEFMDLALKSEHPCELGNRCTVFIEGSINKALAEGHKLEDVCAGLAVAIVSNYLQRVVNQKPIGNHIALQGGIAYNKAVVCAFRMLTGKDVRVSPYFSVTGALGAASLSMKDASLVFDKEKNRAFNAKLNALSEESYLRNYVPPVKGSGKKVVGVPRVIFLHKMFPMFNSLFRSLGFDVLLTPLTNAEIIAKAQAYVTAETCYPIKLIYGHVAWLVEQGVDYIVLPRLYTIKHEGSVARKDYACMYMQTSPLIMEQAFHLKERGITLISPELSLQFGKKFMIKSIVSIADTIGVPKPMMVPAAVKAFATLTAHSKKLEELGKGSLDGDEPVFVIISRVYNIIDPALNMGIEERLNELGCKVVHLEHLEASYMNVKHDYKDMYWPFGQHILTGLKIVKTNKNLYPIYITNHGCGPDTAIQHFFQNKMQGREYLQLEVDEHASKVGIITRLEAFLYSLQPQVALPMERPTEPENEAKCALIPDFGIYSDLIEKYLPKKYEEVVRVKPLSKHHNFNYAMNKEYYSMLVTLEEILDTVKKGKTYDMYFSGDEGSEVFGQFAFLCHQELRKRGFDVNLRHFYLEDLIKRKDYELLYRDMLELEKANMPKVIQGAKRIFALGEPLCVYKPYINRLGKENISFNPDVLTDAATNANTYVYDTMPFSEALLFHMITVDRKHEYCAQIAKWRKMHDKAMAETSDTDMYTDMDTLFEAAKGKLDFCIGDSAKYRFAKLLSLTKNTSGAVLLHSAEENVSIILKLLQENYKKNISIPYTNIDMDFEHEM